MRSIPPGVAALVMTCGWTATFGWLSVVRHLAGGTHAEDLGFTDQVLWNFAHGQWFRMSIYSGATWNTELDLSRVARPDSLLAFHFEPMLLLLVPLYVLGGGATALLALQAAAVGAGAIPAFRLGQHAAGSVFAGLAVAAAYLLSPLGQWAVLADFHTSTLAAPLLILAAERLIVSRSPAQAVLAAALATTAREDVGPPVALAGLVLIFRRRRVGAVFIAVGVAASLIAALFIRSYSGGMSPFDVRYGAALLGGLSALTRPQVLEYARTLLLSGGWLGLLSPLSVLPALPSLVLNVFSTSAWMSSGKAHYSALVLPFVIFGAVSGLKRLRGHRPGVAIACAGLLVSSAAGYLAEGAGPLGGNYAPATVTEHATSAAAIAAQFPSNAAVSATSSLVPRVSQRASVYVFPAVLNADFVFVDLKASPAPTSSGDVFLRVNNLLSSGGWTLETADDGLMVLRRDPNAGGAMYQKALDGHADGAAQLVAADLVASPEGAIDVDGPRGTLRTTWYTNSRLPEGSRLEFVVDLDTGQQVRLWDVADLWWNPPDRWQAGKPTTIDVPDIPIRHFKSWQAVWSRG